MKKKTLLLVILSVLVGQLAFGAQEIDGIVYRTERARVLEVGEMIENEDGEFSGRHQDIRVRMESGPKKGEEISLVNNLSDNAAYDFIFNEGDKVTITVEYHRDIDEEFMYISDHYRIDVLMILGLVFLVLILAIGRKQGLRAIVSLGLTIGAVVYFLLPNILRGKNPIVYSVIVSIGVTIITILLITGFSKKSLGAIIGTSVGVLLAGLISYFVGMKIKLTGLSAEDATMLMFIPQDIEFNFQHLLFAGIILGALGAVMDVGMSIASAIEEIYQANRDLTEKELFMSGMNVGKDIMGTMVNTLILAYTGTSIPLLLVFMAHGSTAMEVMNLDTIATEIVRSISGSIGLILTIPITAFATSVLIKRDRKELDGGEK